MVEKKHKVKLTKLISTFKEAEKQLKHSEHDTNNLSIPSINQMRYVAYHLVESFEHEDDKSIEEEIEKATNHAQRARYDAVEIGILYYLEQIKIFQEKYSEYTETLTILPNYIDHLTKAQAASDKLQLIKEEEKEREDYYQAIVPSYQELKEVSTTMQNSIPLINKKIEENNEIRIRENRRFAIKIGLTILGILITATVAVLKLGLV